MVVSYKCTRCGKILVLTVSDPPPRKVTGFRCECGNSTYRKA